MRGKIRISIKISYRRGFSIPLPNRCGWKPHLPCVGLLERISMALAIHSPDCYYKPIRQLFDLITRLIAVRFGDDNFLVCRDVF